MARKNIDNVNTRRDEMLRFRQYQAETRKRSEEKKIVEGNQRLLKRILEVPGCYDVSAWEADAVRHEEYLKNMSEFPELQQQTRAAIAPPLRPRTSSAINMQRLSLKNQLPQNLQTQQSNKPAVMSARSSDRYHRLDKF